MESQKLTSLLWAWLLNQATEVAENQNLSIEGQESRCYINLPSLLPYSNIKHYLWLWQWLFSWFDESIHIIFMYPSWNLLSFVHTQECEILLKLGADVNAEDQYGCTPLYYAVENASPSIMFLLLMVSFYINGFGENLVFFRLKSLSGWLVRIVVYYCETLSFW